MTEHSLLVEDLWLLREVPVDYLDEARSLTVTLRLTDMERRDLLSAVRRTSMMHRKESARLKAEGLLKEAYERGLKADALECLHAVITIDEEKEAA
jgi:hypothetical protein